MATGSRTAVHDDLPVRGELVQTVLKFSEGNQHRPIRLQIHDLPLMRLAHVQQKRRLRRRQALRELDSTDLTNWIFHPLLLSLSGCIQPAEIFIVDESGLCRLIATNRATRVPGDCYLSPIHLHRVKEQQPTTERVSPPQHQLDHLEGLNRSYDPWQNPQYTCLRTIRDQTRRRRLSKEASVTRSAVGRKHRGLALPTEDRSVDVRLSQEHTGVVDEVPGREVVGPVGHDVVRP